MADTINGYPIRANFETPAAPMTRPGRFILAELVGQYHPWVTAWLGDGDASWTCGHYHHDRHDAERDFLARCEREIVLMGARAK